MPLVENRGSFLLLTAVEPYSLQGYKDAVRLARKLCKQYGLNKVVTDIRPIDRNIPVVDRFYLGVEIAKVLGAKIQLAILAPAAIIDRLGENTAVNRGGWVKVTASMEEALKWLGVNEQE